MSLYIYESIYVPRPSIGLREIELSFGPTKNKLEPRLIDKKSMFGKWSNHLYT